MLLQKNERGLNDQVSVVKGIAILGVLLEHATTFNIPILGRYPSMLMLPIFVIASGYCFKDYYITHRLTFVKRRIKSLYWPFVKWAAIFVFLHNVFCFIGFYPANIALYSWRDILGQVPHILMMHTFEPLIGANWFIAELFFGAMLFIALIPLIKRYPLVGVIGFAALAVIFNLTGFHLRLRDVSLMCASYYTLGFWVRGRKLNTRWFVIILLLALLVLGALIVPGNFQVMSPRWIIPNYATVIVGSWIVAIIAWYIVKHCGWLSRFLVYIGNHTLIILTLHFTAMHIVSWIIATTLGLPHEYISNSPVMKGVVWAWPFYFIAGILLPLAFDFANKKFWKCLKKACCKQ